jgi:DNA-binding protein HU-beta
MTKADLVEGVAAQAVGMSRKSAGELVDSIFDAIRRAIRNEGRFSYPRFGAWSVRLRRARRGRNPRTGAEIHIAAARTVGFRPANELKATLQSPPHPAALRLPERGREMRSGISSSRREGAGAAER